MATGARKARMANVVVDVEVLVIHPYRMPFERDTGEPLPVARDEVELGRNEPPDEVDVDPSFGRGEWTRLEDGQPGHVHVCRARFEREERGVQVRKSFVVAGHVTSP
jgi:hypothetical protein